MKIKVVAKPYDEVMKLAPEPHQRPRKQSLLLRTLLRVLSSVELKKVNYTCNYIRMEELEKHSPCLVLMNHSSSIDFHIASRYFQNDPFHIVCTTDGLVGKSGLMRTLGCIPTRKFSTDVTLLKDMVYALKQLKSSVLMYPEASYSFDGTATPIPPSLGKCVKFLGVPVVMIRTHGAFLRDPLYNNLQLRKVDVHADIEYLFLPEQIASSTVEELNTILRERFTFDAFREQQEQRIAVNEPFRADGLNRVLYQCPHCMTEGEMVGKGEELTCKHCHATYRLTEYGLLERTDGGEAAFTHIPDWYSWERNEVRKQLLDGSYRIEIPVDIGMLVDTKAVYRVGSGTLTHTREGFDLIGCDGALNYHHSPLSSYSLYADYFWYEISDIICISSGSTCYYCFLPEGCDVAAKARIAAEELYKLKCDKLL